MIGSETSPQDDSSNRAATPPQRDDALAHRSEATPGESAEPTTGSREGGAAFTPGALTPGQTPGRRTPGHTSGPPSPAALREGKELPGRAGERRRFLGRGGYGEVWAVRYANDDEAWKYFPKRPGSDFLAFREGFNARSVKHPNVVRVLDISEDDENYIVRMDLVAGRDLHRVVNEDGVFAPELVCRYVVQIADALRAAHEAGVLHLDLKPSNLILKESGESVMVTDFGISATLGGGLFQVDERSYHGTPHFLSPEQVRGEAGGEQLGPGVDIWALGVTIYYLLTRSYPFRLEGRDPTPILEQEPRPLVELAPYVSDRLAAMVHRMLQKGVADRFGSMTEVRDAFRRHLESEYSRISCPACEQTFALDVVEGVCPNRNCTEPDRIVKVKEWRSLLCRGEKEFASCDFEAAIACYGRLQTTCTIAEVGARAERLSRVATSRRDELGQAIAEVQALLESDDLLATVKRIDEVRRRFAAAKSLRTLHDRTLGPIQERCRSFRDEVSRLVKSGRFGFADAKRLLMQVEGFLGYEPLLRNLEESGDRLAQRVRDLFAWVDDREQLFGRLEKDLDRRIQDLEFGRAAECVRRLRQHFPSFLEDLKREQQLKKVKEVDQAPDAQAFDQLQKDREAITSLDVAGLRKALDAGGALPVGDEPAEVIGGLRRCARLLEAIDRRRVPRMAEIEARQAEIQEFVEQVAKARAERERTLEEVGDAGGGLEREVRALEVLVSIADGTDLVSLEDATRFKHRYRRSVAKLEHVRERYAAAMAQFAKREFGEAIPGLQEVERDAPGLYADVSEVLAKCFDGQEHDSRVLEEVQQLFNRILGDSIEVDDFQRFFGLLKDIESPPDEVRADLRQKVESVLRRLMTWQGAEAGNAVDEGGRWAAFRTVVGLVQTANGAVVDLVALLNQEAPNQETLNQAFLEFFGVVVEPLLKDPLAPSKADFRIERLGTAIAELNGIEGFCRGLKRLQFHDHPAERIGQLLHDCRRAVLRGPNPRPRLEKVLQLYRQLPGLCRDEKIQKELRRRESRVRRSIHWATLEGIVRRGVVLVRSSVTHLAAMAGGALLYFALDSVTNANATSSLVQQMVSPEKGKSIVLPKRSEVELVRDLIGWDRLCTSRANPVEFGAYIESHRERLHRYEILIRPESSELVKRAVNGVRAFADDCALRVRKEAVTLLPGPGNCDQFVSRLKDELTMVRTQVELLRKAMREPEQEPRQLLETLETELRHCAEQLTVRQVGTKTWSVPFDGAQPQGNLQTIATALCYQAELAQLLYDVEKAAREVWSDAPETGAQKLVSQASEAIRAVQELQRTVTFDAFRQLVADWKRDLANGTCKDTGVDARELLLNMLSPPQGK